MPTLQTCASGAHPALADVTGPSAIAAAKHTNAQARAEELIIIFVNFVFIVVVSFCLSSVVFGLVWLLQRGIISSRSFLPLQIAAEKFQDFLLEDKNLGRPPGLDLSP